MMNIHYQNCYKKKRGMTLVEIILAMAIFSILVLAFMSVFSGVYLGVSRSASQGQAYHQAQADIESQIGDGLGYYTGDHFELTFTDGVTSGVPITVRNWKVDSQQSVHQAEAELSTFVPLFPAIEISPSVIYEGQNLPIITITGHGTNFSSTATTVEIQDMSGHGLYDIITEVNAETKAKAEFAIPAEIFLRSGTYIFHVETDLGDGQFEISRARFVVDQPLLTVAGDVAVYISADGLHWQKRVNPVTASMLAVAFSGDRLLAVGETGQLYSQKKYDNDWSAQTIPVSSVRSALHIPYWSSFFFTGQQGTLYRISADFSSASTVSLLNIPELSDIRDIDYKVLLDGTQKFMGVASGGSIFYTADTTFGDGLASYHTIPDPAFDLKSITAGYLTDVYGVQSFRAVAAGSGGQITVSQDGLTWAAPVVIDPAGRMINEIKYYYQNGKDWFYAVGENGLLMYSNDLANWTDLASVTGETLNDVYYSSLGNFFIAVGENSTIIRSSDGLTWSAVDLSTGPISDNFNAVFGQ